MKEIQRGIQLNKFAKGKFDNMN